MHQFSIITPTYNRAKYLPRIYNSLISQGNFDFEWIIVDDGSTDNTKEIIDNFNKVFDIKYIYKSNGGQVSAWNIGTENTDSYIVVKLDDDDILCPDILNKVWSYFDPITNLFKSNTVCLSGLCCYENGEIICGKYPHDYIISDHIRYIENKYLGGDRCEFFITNIFKKYPFPIIKNEKNIAPSIVLVRIALSYKTIYINEVFQIKEYIHGGLSTQSYFNKYPLGSELVFNERTIPPFRLKLQIKYSALYIYFAKINKRKQIYLNAKNKLIFPLGFLVYILYFIKKHLEKYQFFHFLVKKESKRFTKE